MRSNDSTPHAPQEQTMSKSLAFTIFGASVCITAGVIAIVPMPQLAALAMAVVAVPSAAISAYQWTRSPVDPTIRNT